MPSKKRRKRQVACPTTASEGGEGGKVVPKVVGEHICCVFFLTAINLCVYYDYVLRPLYPMQQLWPGGGVNLFTADPMDVG